MLRELWSDIGYRVRALVRRDHMEQDLDAELRFHVECQAEEFERRGMARDEALRQARLAFGGVEQMKEASRDSRGTALLEALLQDARYAVRSLRKEPTFTLAVVLILAMGIGANTTTFTVINALLLRPLPVPHPEALVTIGDPAAVGSGWHGSPETAYVSYPVYADVRDRNHVLSGVYASGSMDTPDVIVRGAASGIAGPVEHPYVRLVTGNYFAVLQVPAYMGRTFTAVEDRVPGRDPVTVVSYAYWQRRFARDPSALGSEITVNGVALTIVGVTPAGFAGDIVGQSIDLWVPMMMQTAISPKRALLEDRTWSWLQMMGRLAPGITFSQAQGALSALEAQSIREHITGVTLSRFEDDLKESPIRIGLGARGFSRYREEYGTALIVLTAAVGLVVLIVCANIANLMLVRGVARGREMTVRMALGAGRARLIRQLLTESSLLAATGGALGVYAAEIGSRLLLAIANTEPTRPFALDVAPDGRVLWFTAGLTLVCATLCGLVPALRATRVDLTTALRAQGRSLLGARARLGRFALGQTLVVAQIALSAVLLIGAGLLTRSMQRIVRADLGLDRDRLLLVHVAAQKGGYEGVRVPALMRDLMDRTQRVPGVVGVSYSRHAVFTGGVSSGHATAPGTAPRSDAQRVVLYDEVGPNHFHAIGARVLRGREFDARDAGPAQTVAVINETMANDYFPGANPIGRPLLFDDSTLTIVGVVGDVQEQDVRDKPRRRMYLSILQGEAPPGFLLEVRVAGEPSAFVAALRSSVLEADRNLPIEIEPVNDLVLRSVAENVLVTKVTAVFGLVALVLAALGLYGVIAYTTTWRTGEFGLRVALGAEPWSVTRMILREALGLAAAGLALGVPAGLAATRLIRGQMFGVGPIDPPSLAVAVGMLVATALVASYLPARRAARVAPLDALRTE